MSTAHLPNRRALLRWAGAGLAASTPALHAASALHSTVDLTEGPFFVDERLARTDLRIDPANGSVQAGLPLRLSIGVSSLDTASGATRAIPGAMVDLWQCNAEGVYSDVRRERTHGQKFLRGYQLTDDQGRVGFTTIVPGSYPGRSPHIHCRVRGLAPSTADGLTTQFFFDEALMRSLLADASLPYRNGAPLQPLSRDGIHQGSNTCKPGAVAGESLGLTVRREAGQALAHVELFIDAAARCRSRETRPVGGPPAGDFMPGRDRGPRSLII